MSSFPFLHMHHKGQRVKPNYGYWKQCKQSNLTLTFIWLLRVLRVFVCAPEYLSFCMSVCAVSIGVIRGASSIHHCF